MALQRELQLAFRFVAHSATQTSTGLQGHRLLLSHYRADTSAAVVGFYLHFNTLERTTLTRTFQR
jgi:hypothetical protein